MRTYIGIDPSGEPTGTTGIAVIKANSLGEIIMVYMDQVSQNGALYATSVIPTGKQSKSMHRLYGLAEQIRAEATTLAELASLDQQSYL